MQNKFQSASSFRAPRRSRLRNWVGGLAMLGLILIIAVVLEKIGFASISRSGHAQAIDGDSLRLNNVEMRLKGLDAPEYAQICTDSASRDIACGKQARAALAGILQQGEALCVETQTDRYGRALVSCKIDGNDIGARLVRDGHAVAYGNYELEEAQAKAARRGIWAGSFERPADWRKRHPRADGKT